MKKNRIFDLVLLFLGVLLFMLRVTGMTAHIIISLLGIIVLVIYTITAKKEWKIPALEIIMRVFYGMAIISGGIMMKVGGVVAFAVIHKLSAALFVVLLVALFIHKLLVKKNF